MSNLLPNPSAAVNLTGWTANSDASLARVTSVPGLTFPASLATALRTDAGGSGSTYFEGDDVPFAGGIGPGSVLAWSVWLTPGASGAAGTWDIGFDTYLSGVWHSFDVVATPTQVNGWTLYYGTWTVPAGCDGFDLWVDGSDYRVGAYNYVSGASVGLPVADLSAHVTISIGGASALQGAVAAELSAHVSISIGGAAHLVIAQPAQTLSATVGISVADPDEASSLGEPTPDAVMSAVLAIAVARRRSRLIAAAPGSDPGITLIGGPSTPWPLPATDDVGWIAPDVTPPDIRGLSVKLSGKDLQRALIEEWSIELSDRGGPESSALTFYKDVREPPVKMLAILNSVYKGQRLFKGRLEARTRDLADSMGTTLTFTGAMRALSDHRAFRKTYVDCDLASNWSIEQGNAGASKFAVRNDSQGIALDAQVETRYWPRNFIEDAPGPGDSCRAYYELAGGAPVDEVVRLVELDVETGGWFVPDEPWFRLAVYSRETLDGPNLECLMSQLLLGPGPDPEQTFTRIPYLSLYPRHDMPVRCIVAKFEYVANVAGVFVDDSWLIAHPHAYDDQAGNQYPPFGARIRAARVFAQLPARYSNGRGVVRPVDAIRDIVSPVFSTVNGLGSVGLEVDQLDFRDIPKARLDALDDVDALLGYDYWSYEDDVLDFQAPDGGDVVKLPINDQRVSMHLSENIDQTFGAVRVKWTDRHGHPRETIANKDSATLGELDKADCIDAPYSVKSAKSATRLGLVYLRDHVGPTVSDAVTVKGIIPGFGDALLCRPGMRVKLVGASGISKALKVTRVTLHPLDWSADLQFDVSPWRFDRLLARLTDDVHSIRR